MTTFYLKANEIFTEEGIVQDSFLKITDGRIAAIDCVPEEDANIMDLGDHRIVPGFIDLHIHGSGGFDVMDASHEAINTISKTIAAKGL